MRPVLPGQSHPVVPRLKRRYRFTSADPVYSDDLVQHVRGEQRRLNLSVTGVITEDLLDKLGISYP